MPFEDITIVCRDCEQEFIHSAEDQARYAERGFDTQPKSCRSCREKRKERSRQSRGGGGGGGGGGRGGGRGGGGGGRGGGGGTREEHDAVCADCGVTTTVPFKPRGDRPVYCRDCFRGRR